MTDLKQQLSERVKQLENNLDVYTAYVNDPSNPEDDRKVVSFKLFYEMVSFSALVEFVPEYTPSHSTNMMMITGFKGVNNYVNVVDGKVVISPEYRELLKQKEAFLKQNIQNG